MQDSEDTDRSRTEKKINYPLEMNRIITAVCERFSNFSLKDLKA